MGLKVGFDICSGTSQAGTDAGIPGTLQAETVKKGLHKVTVQRLSDNEYWNATTGAFAAPNPAEADELDFRGSESDRGIHPAIRRLQMRLPKELLDGVDDDGLVIIVYAAGDDPATLGTSITLGFDPVTP